MNIYLKLFFTALFTVYTIDALANMIGTAFSNSFKCDYQVTAADRIMELVCAILAAICGSISVVGIVDIVSTLKGLQ
jgi:hypothetical protein